MEELILCQEGQPGSNKVDKKLQRCLSVHKVQSAVLQDNHLVWLDVRKFKALVTNKGVCMRVQKTAKIYEKVNKIFFTDEKNCLKCIILVTLRTIVCSHEKK